jgi:SSS family solute:Na+ symporter
VLSQGQLLGAACTFALISFVASEAMKRVKSFDDFATGGGSLGAVYVAGTILGTIVGGAATIGAAQLAFSYGLAGWWFSLGSLFALAFLGLVLSDRLRSAGVKTIPQFLVKTYGERVGPWSWLFTSIGLLMNIIGQVLAATSLLSTVFGMKPVLAAMVTFAAMMLYVVYGGVWSTGSVGVVKTLLLLGSMLVVGFVANGLAGGVSSLARALPRYPYFSLFGRGLWTDLAAGFSLLVGVASTQTYIQALFSAKNPRAAKQGALLAALLAPVAGLPGVYVGMHMKVTQPGISAGSALPLFVTQRLHPVLAGIVLATLFISVIGTAAGLSLGVGVMFGQDIMKKRLWPGATDRQVLVSSRLAIGVTGVIALVVALSGLDSLILKWSFLSMGIRGSTVFFPLLGAVFFRDRVSRRAGLLSIAVAPLLSLLWGVVFPGGIDPLYIGLATSLLCLWVGSALMPDRPHQAQQEVSRQAI